MSSPETQGRVLDRIADTRVSRRRLMQTTGAAAALSAATALPFQTIRAAEGDGWNRETDVVVVGTGASGTPAAIEAARAGSQVLRLEKVEIVGGNMSHSQGIIYLGGGTDLQKQHGFEDTPDGMYAYLEAWLGPWEDPEFVRFYVDNSVDHYNWLVGEGVDFGTNYTPDKVIAPADGSGGLGYSGNEANYPYEDITPPVPRGHFVVGFGAGMSKALQASADAEPNITTLVNAPVSNLITDETDRVIGVIAEINGVEERILARQGVVLASGGYEMNEAMLEQTLAAKYPLIPQGSSYRGNTGDGIRMAASLGARLRDMDITFSTPFVYPPNERVHSILINSKGRRFVNEASYGAVLGDVILNQEQNVAWLVADQTVTDALAATGYDVTTTFAVADTLEEVAAAINVPASVLVNEVAFYNEHAANGEDPVFHKHAEFLTPLETPPFYVYDFTAFMPFLTTGHVEIDIDTHVLDQDGEIIPGLHAAGQNGAGIGRRFYNSGIRLGEGSFFGRVAGRTVAAAEPWAGDVTITPIAATPVAATAVAGPQGEEFPIESVDIAFTTSELTVPADTTVTITLTNTGFLPHDIAIDGTEFGSALANNGETVYLTFSLPAGEYTYFCTVPGHREAGMVGTLVVA